VSLSHGAGDVPTSGWWLRFLDLLCEPCQLGDLDAEGGGDSPDGAPGWVASGLDMAEPCRVENSTVGDLLLRRDTASMASANLDLIRSIYAAWGRVK
jgi:hypothetical protein